MNAKDFIKHATALRDDRVYYIPQAELTPDMKGKITCQHEKMRGNLSVEYVGNAVMEVHLDLASVKVCCPIEADQLMKSTEPTQQHMGNSSELRWASGTKVLTVHLSPTDQGQLVVTDINYQK